MESGFLQFFLSVAPKCEHLQHHANSREFAIYMLGFIGDDHPELSTLIRACLARDPGVNSNDSDEDF